MIKKETKQTVIKQYARKEGDTGSSEVQIAILTARIQELTEHIKKNPNDLHSRRGLTQLVSNRKKHLKYLEKTDLNKYRELKAQLKIR